MDKVGPYFSFQGRANRQRYWLTVLALIGVLLAGSLISYAFRIPGLVIGVGVFLAAVVAGLALAVRRLHDRGKSGWWLLPMYVPAILLSVVNSLMEVSQGAPNPVLSLLTLPFSIWAFVELGCLQGTVGPNRFGPDPLESSVAAVFG